MTDSVQQGACRKPAGIKVILILDQGALGSL